MLQTVLKIVTFSVVNVRYIGKEQCTYLSNILNAIAEKDMQLLQGTKLKKLNTLVDISLHLRNKKWIPDLNLGFTELHYIADNEQICDAIINASMLLICREYPLFSYQSTTLLSTMLTYSPVNIIHVHHNGHGHKMEMFDCGTFAIAYAMDIAAGNNPTTIVYDQSEMRQHLLECLPNHKMKPFPRFRNLTNQVPPVNITKDIDSTQKWVTPRKHAKRKTLCTDNISNDISTKNWYALLTNQTGNVDFST